MCSNNLKLPIRAAPYRHQREAATFALDRLANGGGAALLMEMGTGKTLTTIAIVGRLWQEKRVQRLLSRRCLSLACGRTNFANSRITIILSPCWRARARGRRTPFGI